MANKDERRKAYADLMSATLSRTVDFLKFAETKNAALLTFASAWTFAAINLLTRDHPPGGIVGSALRLTLTLFALAAAVTVVSFLPRLNLHALHRDPMQEKNLLFFAHIAEFDPAVFKERARERYHGQGDELLTDDFLNDLAIQVSANSALARRKYRFFNSGAGLVLFALVMLAFAVISAAVNHATGGVWLWA